MNTPLITWDQPGESVAGRLIEIRNGRKFSNRQSRVAEIRRKDGTLVAVTLSRILDAMLDEQNVRRGDRIRIRFRGWKTPKTGHRYRRFTLDVR